MNTYAVSAEIKITVELHSVVPARSEEEAKELLIFACQRQNIKFPEGEIPANKETVVFTSIRKLPTIAASNNTLN